MINIIFSTYTYIFLYFYIFLEFRYGRKNTYFPCWLAVIITVFGSSFVQHFWIFFIMRFLIGVFCGGFIVTSKVIATELVGEKYRSLLHTILVASNSVSIILIGLQAWALQNWTHLQMVASIPYIICIAGYW